MKSEKDGRQRAKGAIARRLGVAIAAACLLAGVSAASASALDTYVHTESIIAQEVFAPTGMAIDQSTGDLYVAGNIGVASLHRFDAVTEKERVFGEGNYESVAVNPVTHEVDALTKPPAPLRVEIYEPIEDEIGGKPIPTPGGRGVIGTDSLGDVFVPDVGAVNEQQKYTVSAASGTYKLGFEGEETAPIEWNAQEYQVREALAALAKIGGEANIEVTRSGQTYTVLFQGTFEHVNVPQLTADGSGLTEGSVSHLETVVEGSNAPPSVREYSPGGVALQTITCGACPGGNFTEAPTGVALDGADNLYVAETAGHRVLVFHATAGNPTNYHAAAPVELATGSTKAMTVNPANDDVWVGGDDGEGFHVKGFKPDGTKFADFGTGVFTGPFAQFYGTQKLAVNAKTGMVYVDDLMLGNESIRTEILGFSPAPPPTIEATPAGVEASRHATMKAKLNPNGTIVLSCKFEYGPTEAYGTTVPCNDPGFANEPVVVSAEAEPLAPNTIYHYRVTATNEGGTTVGPDQQLTTLIDKATATTGGAAAQQFTATLEGTVNPGGNPLTECFFEYGPDQTYGTQAPCASLPTGSSDAPVTANVAGLQPNTEYHYRMVANNAGGSQVGADRALKTLPKAPAITTGAATLVGPDKARISGTVNPEGSVSRYQFEYGQTTAYGSTSASATAVGEETIKVAENLTGLEPATIYHYRLSATSVGGTTHGPDQTFTTGPRPIGRVFLPAKAKLKHGKASIEVQCRGVAIAECQGNLVLRGRIKQGIRFILVKVGSTSFDFFGGQKVVMTVPLNQAGRKVVSQSEGKPIPVVASAANKNRVVRLSRSGH
jgi:hypothetical protein